MNPVQRLPGAPGVEAPPATGDADELMAVSTVARLCGCSSRQVYRMAAAGLMPPQLRLGTMCRWRRSEIMKWIKAGCPASGGAA